jgi:hypothetical protein
MHIISLTDLGLVVSKLMRRSKNSFAKRASELTKTSGWLGYEDGGIEATSVGPR